MNEEEKRLYHWSPMVSVFTKQIINF